MLGSLLIHDANSSREADFGRGGHNRVNSQEKQTGTMAEMGCSLRPTKHHTTRNLRRFTGRGKRYALPENRSAPTSGKTNRLRSKD